MNVRQPSRVVIASDQAIFLRGMTSLVMSIPELNLVGEARSAAETLQLCQLSVPDILLLDLSAPYGQAHETTRQVCSRWPGVRVVLFQGLRQGETSEPDDLDCAFSISRDVSEEEFKAALKQIQKTSMAPEEPSSPAHAIFRHHPEDDREEGRDELSLSPTHHRTEDILTRELIMAGKIQEDILPEKAPSIPGWDISARLKPARETSGDFYDFIPLSERKWGIVLADVTDKGMGAALFMALSSTLIRTYAMRFPTLPGLALNAVSERLLTDTRGGMFVTAMFGILEPHSGRFIYANAGHPPGYLISNQRGKTDIQELRPTGMALGVSETAEWKQKIVKLAPGDYLVLYTDGITEAQNHAGIFYGEERLLDVVLSKLGRSSREIHDALIEEVNRFEGYVLQQDDIALIVIHREE
jgi:serine phosphatase RsbU (regulator of sigma subunit)